MSAFPVSRIVDAPSPALTGTSLTVRAGHGALFPIPPFEVFTALIWPVNTTPVVGDNAEYVEVTGIDEDEFTIVRSDAPIVIESGMSIALTFKLPVYRLGEEVTLRWSFDEAEAPYRLTLRSPDGRVGAFGSANGVVDDGDGDLHFTYVPDRSGAWTYRFESLTHIAPDGQVFIEHSPTIG